MKPVAATRDKQTLRIGELATASGLTADALRYYEREGLLPRAPRSTGAFDSTRRAVWTDSASSNRRRHTGSRCERFVI